MKWLVVALAVLAILVVAWLAIEVRYSACVEASPVNVSVNSKLHGDGIFDPPRAVQIKSALFEKNVFSGCWHP